MIYNSDIFEGVNIHMLSLKACPHYTLVASTLNLKSEIANSIQCSSSSRFEVIHCNN